MKKPIKYTLMGLAALVIAGGVLYSALAPTQVHLTRVAPKTAELSFTEQGLFTAGSVITIFPMVQGRLVEVNVEEGQTVREGDLLCVVDAEPLRRRADQIRGAIRGYEAQIAASEDQDRSSNATVDEKMRLERIAIDQAGKNLDRAREDLERAETLFQRGAIARVDVDDARAAVTQRESALRASRQGLNVIAAGAVSAGMADYYRALIEVERLNIEQLERDIENCRVTAAAGGVVTVLHARGTNFITPSSPVAEITVTDGGAIEVFIATRDAGSVRVGDTAVLILKRRNGDVEFAGRVDHVDANAEIKLSPLGLEERKVKVKISPDLREAAGVPFGVGYDVDVRFILYREENKFAVPKTALYRDGDRDVLWVVRGGRARIAEVVKGMELRTEFVIESGLEEGDAVITDANNDKLKDGLRVAGTG